MKRREASRRDGSRCRTLGKHSGARTKKCANCFKIINVQPTKAQVASNNQCANIQSTSRVRRKVQGQVPRGGPTPGYSPVSINRIQAQNNDEKRHVNMAIKSSALMLFTAEQGIESKYQTQYATYRGQESRIKTQSDQVQGNKALTWT